MKTQVIAKASDKKTGMTLADLHQWVHDALGRDVDPRTPVHVVVGFRGQLQQIQTKEAPPVTQ